ncbi:RdgB/HAM1 family non-canonical purine NTP pyrophosphatase [Oceanotoga sp. DSM 15011]|uniref:RdgB/HAM1 family non-canonical purine NTP pyrophosphatase n=1 Tax=Oceanotoga sp. DSM 15011 TaxID=2984951 RepID=UPI0021F3CC6B|nr:RdgB/HAM1 family non-canonical purine NTP pyrophosphatase [Oceanotoga sp. DSM 15011]UYP00137.1 RdgB/HAM1 family non-canonical purine NTP pyrophosphatase [Oceanotoga sp. DSM 15011]
MIDIIIATSNDHKVDEISNLAPENFKITSIKKFMGNLNIEEYGKSFIENSVIKAINSAKIINKPVIADDSGLCIKSLDGFPGIFSARYMETYSYEEKMLEILKILSKHDNRDAYFACAASYFDPSKDLLISFEGKVEGHISDKISGLHGFGYDPFFIPKGYSETFGVLSPKIKNKISHRSKAFNGLFDLLSKLL